MNTPTFTVSHNSLLDDFVNIHNWITRYNLNLSVVFTEATTFDIEESELFLNQLGVRLDSIIIKDTEADFTIELDDTPHLVEIINSEIKLDSISGVHVNIYNSRLVRGNPLDRPLIIAFNSINIEQSTLIECDLEIYKLVSSNSIFRDVDISVDEADSSAKFSNCEVSGSISVENIEFD